MAVICEMSCGRGRAEDCRPPPLCGAVISPPEHKTTRVNPSIRINSVQRVNSDTFADEGSAIGAVLEFSDDAGNVLATMEKKTTCRDSIASVRCFIFYLTLLFNPISSQAT